jgi:cystathionine beta-lyase/cystathionine gamma-synthase
VQTNTLFETIDEETVENDVDVVTVKRTKVKQVVETITATNTKAIKIETPNKFENNAAKGSANNQPL